MQSNNRSSSKDDSAGERVEMIPAPGHVDDQRYPTAIQGLFQPPRSLSSITLLLFSMYSTIMSGVFLVIAIIKPQYGYIISARGPLSPSSAALLTAFFAKTIELTFVAVVLAFIGQVLSRRAVHHESVTLANISMRTWILQPGTLFTQWETVRFSGSHSLGVFSIFAALLTLLYTTASGTLVQPQLRLPPLQPKVLNGAVRSWFSDLNAIEEDCKNHWVAWDTFRAYIKFPCAGLRLGSLCSHNHHRYLTEWQVDQAFEASSTTGLERRIPIKAMLDDNITVTTTWFDTEHARPVVMVDGRIVNNITVAVPHRGLPLAASDRRNGILQPEDLETSGGYSIHASVPNYLINSLCVNATREELLPLIYDKNQNHAVAGQYEEVNASYDEFDGYRSSHTVLDSIFQWQDLSSRSSDDVSHARPAFDRLPPSAATIANHTNWDSLKSEVYLLGARPSDNNITDYLLCSLKTAITTECSTRFNASSTGRSLEVLCRGHAGDMAYGALFPNKPSLLPNPNWLLSGYILLHALNLDKGSNNLHSPESVLFTQLQLKEARFNSSLPSPAEALISMALGTVLDIVNDIPFTLDDWINYNTISWQNKTEPLKDPIFQSFSTTVQVNQYMSGGTYPYQRGFIVVLASVFMINALVLTYFALLLRIKFITDICEPLALFLLGYHSLPDDLFEGNAQLGMKRKDFAVPWIVKARYGQLVVVGTEEADEDDVRRGDNRIATWGKNLLRRRGLRREQ